MASDLAILTVVGVLEEAREAGMDLASLREPYGDAPRGDPCVWSRTLGRVMQGIRVDGFPIRVAQRISIGAGSLGVIARSAPDLHTALERMQVLTGTLLPGVHHDDSRRTTILVHAPLEGTDLGSRCRREMRVASTLQFARDVSRAWIRPRRVCFVHAGPRDLRDHQAYFDCDIEFGAEYDGLEFDRDTLAIPLPGSDSDLSQFLVEHVLGTEGAPPFTVESNLKGKLRQTLRGRLGNQALTLAAVAQDLGMSTRTLRRRLLEQRTSYQQILDQVRRELADELLEDSHHAIKEVAFLMGFSQASAFNRAYLRWTGKTPGSRRRAPHGGDA